MKSRCASKTTDKLALVVELLTRMKFKKALVTWDRIEDPEEGTVIVPIISVER